MSYRLREAIMADLFRYEGRNDTRSFIKTLRRPGFRYSTTLRTAFWLSTSKNVFGRLAFQTAKFVLTHYSYKFGYQIPATTQIGAGLNINHCGPIVVNPDAVIGCNVNLHPGITIGQANRGKRVGCPRIGNSVWIGTNAVIVGRITIGNNVLIAPGSYVSFDVPDNAVVSGNPATIVSYAGVEGYIGSTVVEMNNACVN
jgi:serine O-acetyltransferase